MSEFAIQESESVLYKGYYLKTSMGPVVIDPESYAPKQIMNAEFYVPMNTHGGRSMKEPEIALNESILVEEIIRELRPSILEYVKTINPYLRRHKNEHVCKS